MTWSVVSDDGGVLRLKAAGPITSNDASPPSDPLGDLLGSAGYTQKVVLSLAEVDFIDSSGVSWLLVRHKRFREAGGELVIHSVQPMVLQVLQVLRLNLVLNLAENESAALTLAEGDHA